jgi:2-keto-3-deoxy-L-fuconate dehydrogenase
MFILNNKIAVVTGGGSGIGKACALALARQGAVVHVLDLSADSASQVVDMIRKAGGQAHIQTGNVSQQQDMVQLFRHLHKVDILVNCAGISHIGTAEGTSEKDFDRVWQVNVKGVYNCIHAVIPLMKKQGGGVIVNICSIAALVGLPDRFAYSVSKGAIYAMTLSVARDYLHDKIRCNSVSPARVHTPFVDDFLAKNYPGHEKEMFDKLSLSQPIGRMGTAEEVAHLVLFLCSDEAAFITGTDYPMDGGFVKLNT